MIVKDQKINIHGWMGDTLLIANSEYQLQALLGEVSEEKANKRAIDELKKKKASMFASIQTPTAISAAIQQIQHFKYLKFVRTHYRKFDTEIKKN